MFVKTKDDGILNLNKFAGYNIIEIEHHEPASDSNIPFPPPAYKYKLVLLQYHRVSYAKNHSERSLDESYTILETNTKEEAEKALQSINNSLLNHDKYWEYNDSLNIDPLDLTKPPPKVE